MKYIKLTTGQKTLVDDDDFVLVSKYKWHLTNKGYAQSSKKIGFMHRLIMNTPEGWHTDHKNHNPLDNRKDNLRVCTIQQNHQNTIIHRTNSTSGYKGVSFKKDRNKWEVRLRFNGKKIHLGLFENICDAAKTYDIAARKLYGEYSLTNF